MPSTSFLLALPACFFHARDLTFVRKFSEADTADAIFAEIGVRSSADFAPVIGTGGKFRRTLLFIDH
jgi:hypothetical protein